MGKIVLEDFNGGNGYYKINLAYLNKDQVEKVESLVSTWNPTDEDIKSCIRMCLTDADEQRFKDYDTNLKDCLAWLEKQKEQKPVDNKKVEMTEFEQSVYDLIPVLGIEEAKATASDLLELAKKTLLKTGKVVLASNYPEGCSFEDGFHLGYNEGFNAKQKEQHPSSRFRPNDWVVYDGPLGHAILQVKDVVDGRYTFIDNDSTLLEEDSDKFLRPLTPKDVEKPAEWKPQPESLEALMYAIEGKWDAISPTSYLSRRLEDLYEGLVNTYNVDESLLSELPEAASRAYTAEDIEELRELKRKIEASMEQKPVEKQDYSGLNDFERAIHRGFLSAGVENVPVTIIKETAKECLAQMKPAEWSEEEAKKAAEDYADEYPGMTHENDGSTVDDYDKPYNDFMAGVLWAKHHGIFQNGNTNWKPNEDEERLINTTISFLKDFADKGYENAVECIDWLKSKLNGNSCK